MILTIVRRIMAEGNNVEDLLNCPVCLERFEDPKILQCHHSFCGNCLDKIQQQMGGQSVNCPTCRKTTKLTAIETSFFINNLLTATPQPVVTDEKCQHMPQSYFCRRCSLTMCRNCKIQQHKDHDIALVDDEIIAIHSKVTDVTKIITEVENASQLLLQAETDIIEQEKQVEETVNSAADKLIQGINQQREELLQQARENAERKMAVIKAQQNEATATVSHLKTSKEAAEALLQTESKQEVLQGKSNTIQGLETSIAKVNLESLNPAEKPDIRCTIKHITHLPKPFASISASFMEEKFVVIASPPVQCMREEAILTMKYTGDSFKPSSAIISAHVEATRSSDVHPCKVTNTKTKGIYNISFTPTTPGLHKVVIQANDHLIKAVSPISIHVPGRRYPLTVLQSRQDFNYTCINGIGVSRNTEELIGLTSNNEIYLFSPGAGQLKNCREIITPNSSKIAIADDGKSIYVIDKKHWQVKKYDSNNGTLLAETKTTSRFSMKLTECPAALTIHPSGQLYVIGSIRNKPVVTEFYMKALNLQDLSCLRDYDLEVNLQKDLFDSRPSDIALDTLGNIYISGERHSCIYKINEDTLEKEKIVGKGSDKGQLENPQAIAIDSDDILYVADTGNDRISVFNTDGVFLTCLGENELSKPNGIAICNNGTIYVTDAGNNRIVTF